MDLGEVLKTYLSDDQQGQLVIKFSGEDHLCKIAVENGQAIYMTLGTKGPEEALEVMVGKVAEWSNFIKGLPVRKRLDTPLNQQLLRIAGAAPLAGEEIPLPLTSEPQAATDTESVADDVTVEPAQIKLIVERFIDLVGPFGTILTEKICTTLAHVEGAPMNAAIYTRFITALAAEIPEPDRQGFIEAATL